MKLSIKNFKCFKDVSIDFNDLTVLTGSNASGKSSIIQALLLQRNFFIENESIITEVVEKKTFPRPVYLNDDNGLELVNSSEILYDDASENFIQFDITGQNNAKCSIQFLIPDNKKESQINISKDYQINKSFLENIPLVSKERFHYLCAERIGPRINQKLSGKSPPTIGHKGEYLAHIISYASRTKILQDRCYPFVNSQNYTFKAQLNSWLNFIIPNTEVKSNILKSNNLAQIMFSRKSRPASTIVPTNTGFGISYFLPILGSCLLAPPNSILIIENPEAHLSPQGQSRIGLFLGYMVKAGLKIIIETHSDHVINGVRKAVKNNVLQPGKILFNYFYFSDNTIVPLIESIKIDQYAKLESWPKGFFDQIDLDLADLNKTSDM